MGFAFRKNSDLEAFRDITDDVLESDFAPYTCHYTPHTLLTTNGELVQTIKVTGQSYESASSGEEDLRQAIRKAILGNINSNAYALWFHTIRRKSDLRSNASYRDPVTRDAHAAWNRHYRWQERFTNEVYITIVREGQSAAISHPRDFLRGLWPKAELRHRWAFLDRAYDELERVTRGMLEMLAPFGAHRLTLEERDGIVYSQPCQFLSKIINLTDEALPLPEIDLSSYLTQNDITFGFNAMEVRTQSGTRRFGSILTLKEYKELSAAAADRFLQLPLEFIVTQCIDFIHQEQALGEYEYQKSLTGLSGDETIGNVSGLDDILASNRGRTVDYGQQQLSVFLLADDLRTLEQHVALAVSTLTSLGIISVREDVKFEECYWAQLPANFEFVKRLKSINTRRIAGFSSISNVPTGREQGNHWGEAVTTLKTMANTPYFFNFHLGDNGHTAIIGPEHSHVTPLTHFLLSEARKFGNRLLILDRHRQSEIFIRALEGHYDSFGLEPAGATALNPLSLADNDKNRRFLYVWLLSLIGEEEARVAPATAETLRAAVTQSFLQPPEERTLKALKAWLAAKDAALSARLAPWVEGGRFAALFDHPKETLDVHSHSVIGFDLDALCEHQQARLSVFLYLFHRISLALDGAPSILVLHEAWEWLDNPVFAARVEGLFGLMRKNNALVISTSRHGVEALHSPITPMLLSHCATQMYLSGIVPSEEQRETLGLSDHECMLLETSCANPDAMTIRRGSDALAVEFSPQPLGDLKAIFEGSAIGRERMERCMQKAGAHPAQWLPLFRSGG